VSQVSSLRRMQGRRLFLDMSSDNGSRRFFQAGEPPDAESRGKPFGLAGRRLRRCSHSPHCDTYVCSICFGVLRVEREFCMIRQIGSFYREWERRDDFTTETRILVPVKARRS
jgi:hypothetical protein